MATTPKTAMTLDVYLWNADDPDDPHHHQVVTGVRERIRAKAHFKKPIDQVLTDGDEEGIVYLAYLGCQRYGHIAEDTTFEEFLDSLFAVDPEGVEDDMLAAAAAAMQAGSQDQATDGGGGDDDRGRG